MGYRLNFILVIMSLALFSGHLGGQTKFVPPKDMDALIELDESVFEIFGAEDAVLRVHRIILVYTDNGKEYGRVRIDESNFYKSKNIKAKILDLNNKTLKRLDKKDIVESNVNYDYTLASDDAFKRFYLAENSLPYKIEYEYEVKYNTLFFWPDWYPQEDDSVLSSIYILKLQEPVSYNTHSIGIKAEQTESYEGSTRVLRWRLENIPPRIKEDFMPPENRIQMALLFTAIDFKLDKYPGSFESWTSFGKWNSRLYEGMQDLSPEAVMQVKEQVKEITDPREKIQKVYSFLQTFTRYVALELGVGGWQPYSADWVFKNKYGDCKDLANFMIAMLKQIGINAYPALVRTRDSGIVYAEFPRNYFNHVISVVPLEGDTLWLDCTVERLVAGQLPYTDEGCNVLIVRDDSAEIVRTPQSGPEENVWRSRIQGESGLTGRLILNGTIEAIGNFGTDLREALILNKGEDQKNLLVSGLSYYVPRFSLSDYKLENIDQNYDQPVRITFEGSITNFASMGGSRLFITPAVFNRFSQHDMPDEEPGERRFAVFQDFPYTTIDSVEIRLPFGYSLESAPQIQDITASFAGYRTDYEINNGTFKYFRYLRINEKLIPVESYTEYKEFMKQVVKSDQTKFVFRKS